MSRAAVASLLAATLSLAGAVGLTSSGATSAPPRPPDVAAVAVANPSPAHPVIERRGAGIDWLSGRQRAADALAQASATCPGCTAVAGNGQVAVVSTGLPVRADNVATAWSHCRSCSATALSVQVVLTKNTRSLTVANRALALNAGCTECASRAAAYQFIVVGSSHGGLTAQARQSLVRIRALMEQELRRPSSAATPQATPQVTPQQGTAAPHASPSGTAQRAALDRLAAQLRAALATEQGAATVLVHGDVRTGAGAAAQ